MLKCNMKTNTPNSCVIRRRNIGRFVSFLFILLNTPFLQEASAKPEDLGIIPADVLCVVDGDTLKIRAKVWIGQTVDTSVRIKGIDAPELKGKCPGERKAALKAKQRVLTLLRIKEEDNICDGLSKAQVKLLEVQTDKYGGRIVARVETENGKDVSEILLSENLARPYHGKTKHAFCQKGR